MQIVKINHKDRRQDSAEGLRRMVGPQEYRKTHFVYNSHKPWIEVLRSDYELSLILSKRMSIFSMDTDLREKNEKYIAHEELLTLIKQHAVFWPYRYYTSYEEYCSRMPMYVPILGWIGEGLYNKNTDERIWCPGLSSCNFGNFTLAIQELE